MKDNPLNRLSVKRGSDLPHAKLSEDDAAYILRCVERRERLRKEAATLSNRALAERFGVHHRTIDKLTAGYSWTHVE